MTRKEKLQALGRHMTTEASVAWRAASSILVSLALPATIFGCAEDTFIWAGLALQLYGLVLVAIGIDSSLKNFDEDSLRTRASNWFVTLRTLTLALFRSEPNFGAGTVVVPLTGTLTATGHASAVLTSAPTTLEGKVAALEADLRNLRSSLAEHAEACRSDMSKLRLDLASNTDALHAAEKRLESLVKDEATGDLHLELIGLITLFFGTLFAGIPGHMSRLCHLIF
jgi:hypothetical protein